MVAVINIPISRQEKKYTCGVAVVKSIFNYFKTKISENKLSKILETTNKDGTNHNNIYKLISKICYCEQLEFLTMKDIEKFINKQYVMIVALQAWDKSSSSYEDKWNSGHYAIIIGYDDNKIYFMDPSSTKYAFINKNDFFKRWHDADKENKLKHFSIVLHHKFSLKEINDNNIIEMK